MHTANHPFLANDQLSDWVRDLYAESLDRDPMDASDDANVLAQAFAYRLLVICLNESTLSTTADLFDSPSSSLWLILALMQARSRDHFHAGAEAQALAVALGARAGRACALPYSQAMETLRPRLLQSALDQETSN
jgi:hypothetical protein